VTCAKIDLKKRSVKKPTKETYKRDLQKRPTEETSTETNRDEEEHA